MVASGTYIPASHVRSVSPADRVVVAVTPDEPASLSFASSVPGPVM